MERKRVSRSKILRITALIENIRAEHSTPTELKLALALEKFINVIDNLQEENDNLVEENEKLTYDLQDKKFEKGNRRRTYNNSSPF